MEHDFGKALADVLVEYRYEQGLTLRELAKTFKMSPTYLCKLEKGIDPRSGKTISPTIETLIKISDGLGITLKKLLSLCGYTDAKELSNREGQLDTSELSSHLDFIIESLKKTEALYYKDRVVTEKDIQAIEDILEIGIGIIEKNQKNAAAHESH